MLALFLPALLPPIPALTASKSPLYQERCMWVEGLENRQGPSWEEGEEEEKGCIKPWTGVSDKRKKVSLSLPALQAPSKTGRLGDTTAQRKNRPMKPAAPLCVQTPRLELFSSSARAR
ncbi:hypothetical protein B0F90DRAFT_705410 [Multifurca ochricompacta]|uniref:Uncharacterized protein n=1 Tax=Multifurca ochricompacta TaxID=376703 RepID=A0AAD4M3R4_9AGAM|nr:hypothetical protein B0F90DRAFT_705410 [Multifurca ochricompacta]